MKKNTLTIWTGATAFSLLSLLITPLALASETGGEAGNGGLVYYCTFPDGKVTVRLVDLKEPSYIDGLSRLQINHEQSGTLDDQIAAAIKRIEIFDPEVSKTLAEYVKSIRAVVKPPVPTASNKNSTPTNTGDSGSITGPDNCSTPNVIKYFSEDRIVEREDLVSKLTVTENAAKFVHEGIYKMIRERRKIFTSLTTRRLVALLFAEKPDSELLRGMIYEYLAKDKKPMLKLSVDLDSPIFMDQRNSLYLNGSLLKGTGIPISRRKCKVGSTECLTKIANGVSDLVFKTVEFRFNDLLRTDSFLFQNGEKIAKLTGNAQEGDGIRANHSLVFVQSPKVEAFVRPVDPVLSERPPVGLVNDSRPLYRGIYEYGSEGIRMGPAQLFIITGLAGGGYLWAPHVLIPATIAGLLYAWIPFKSDAERILLLIDSAYALDDQALHFEKMMRLLHLDHSNPEENSRIAEIIRSGNESLVFLPGIAPQYNHRSKKYEVVQEFMSMHDIRKWVRTQP